jgi:hypothetical protein
MTPLTALLFSLVLSTPEAGAAPDDSFAAIDGHYQAIRLALLEDSTKGVRKHAAAIAKLATELKASPTAARAGVKDADLATVRELLPEVVQRAEVLAGAKKIDAQREALKKLTQPLVRWHEKLTATKTRVAYCSMERGAWFQPDGVLGNPYGGTRMPRCGTFLEQ